MCAVWQAEARLHPRRARWELFQKSSVASRVVLCLSLSDTTQAAGKISPNECAEMTAGQRDLVKCEVARRQGIDIVKGEVLEIEERKYVVGRFYGKEVQLYCDADTQVTGAISPGDSIEAIMSDENDEKRLLSIRQMIK